MFSRRSAFAFGFGETGRPFARILPVQPFLACPDPDLRRGDLGRKLRL